jgi:spore germination protein YaaH
VTPFKKTISLALVLIFSLAVVTAPVFADAAATTPAAAQPFVKLFYYVPGFATYYSLVAHGNQADVFAPQVYNVDVNGTLTGSISALALAVVNKNKTPIMPLVANNNFDPTIMHAILGSTTIQNKLIAELIAEAKSKNYSGWQFDFEHMGAQYRDQYSAFVELAATQFHAAHLQLSVALIARPSDNPNDLPAGSWDNWAGVYDYARIGKAADFVTLMAYDEPGSYGPVAALPWVQKVLTYTEQYIPKAKISLGVPTYGWIWDTDTNTMIRSAPYQKAQDLLSSGDYTSKGFDAASQTSWIAYTEGTGANLVNYKLWYEDAASLQTKLQLAESQKIRGISVWIIGMEDPAVWKIL